VSFDPLVVPTRGLSVKWIDHALLWLSSLLIVSLIFVVSDTIRLDDKYAKLLGASAPTKWHDHILGEAGGRLGIPLGGNTRPPAPSSSAGWRRAPAAWPSSASRICS
jgi:hypothetical protein